MKVKDNAMIINKFEIIMVEFYRYAGNASTTDARPRRSATDASHVPIRTNGTSRNAARTTGNATVPTRNAGFVSAVPGRSATAAASSTGRAAVPADGVRATTATAPSSAASTTTEWAADDGQYCATAPSSASTTAATTCPTATAASTEIGAWFTVRRKRLFAAIYNLIIYGI